MVVAMSYHIISCHVISYHIMSYHIISYVISYHIISYHVAQLSSFDFHFIFTSSQLLVQLHDAPVLRPDCDVWQQQQ